MKKKEKPSDDRKIAAEPSERPEIYALVKDGEGYKISRRGLLGSAGLIGGGPQEAGRIKKEGGTAAPQGLAQASAAGRPRGDSCSALPAHKESIVSLVFLPDSDFLISACRAEIKFWSLKDRLPFKNAEGLGSAQGLAVSRDGRILAAGYNHAIRLWSIPDATMIKSLEGHSGPIQALAFTPDGRYLISGSMDKTIKIWSFAEGTLYKTLEGHAFRVNSLAWNREGTLLASAGADQTIRLWSFPDGELKTTVQVHPGTASSPAAERDSNAPTGETGPDGNAAGPLPTNSLLRALGGRSHYVYALVAVPGENLLISGSSDRRIRFWTSPEMSAGKILDGHQNRVSALAVSPNGRMLVSGSFDKSIRLWTLPDGDPVKTLMGHQDSVSVLAVSPDGKMLASAGPDKTIRLWSLPDGQAIGCLFDAVPKDGEEVSTYRKMMAGTSTMPCGSPLPSGSTCLCNCVAGSVAFPGTHMVCVCDTISVSGGRLPAGMVCVCNTVTIRIPKGHEIQMDGSICTCNTVCTCNTICTCQSVGGGGHYWYPT